MEYLNPSPAPALPQAMWLVYRAAMERPGSSATDLLDLVVPSAMRETTPSQGGHFKSALSALQKLGLIDESSKALRADPVANAAGFLRLLRHRIVQPPEVFGTEFEGADDIRKGLIFLMRESPAKALDYQTDVAQRLESVFVNAGRWNTFRTWCDALGFGQAALSVMTDGRATGRIVPNPTRAVVDAIQKPFGDPLPRGEQISVSRLVNFLRQELPVLPGHPSATFEGFSGDDGNGLRALGLALTGAEELAILRLEYQSDPSSVMALPDAQHGEVRYVSAVTIGD